MPGAGQHSGETTHRSSIISWEVFVLLKALSVIRNRYTLKLLRAEEDLLKGCAWEKLKD